MIERGNLIFCHIHIYIYIYTDFSLTGCDIYLNIFLGGNSDSPSKHFKIPVHFLYLNQNFGVQVNG